MDDLGFLENIYSGFLDQKTMVQYQDLPDDEQTGDVIKQFLTLNKKYPARDIEDRGTVPQELLDELKAIHFFGFNIPEVYGGLGLTLRQYLKVAEVVASQNLDLGFTALAHLSIGVKGILLFGSEYLKERYLPQAASGEMIFSFALTEPKFGSDAQHIETFATPTDDGRHYILNGTKAYITNANLAGGMTVFAQMDHSRPGIMGAFVIETSWDGIRIGKEIPKMGLKASSTAAVHFKNVRVPKENLIGQPGDGFKIAMTILNYGRLGLGAASAALLQASFMDMVHRASQRVQFGKAIDRFELIQEMIVRAKVHHTIISVMTAFTAGMLERDPYGSVAIESSHCKLFGTTKAWESLYDALQMAGGSGYLATQSYEKRMRDFRVTTIFEGTTEIHSIYPALYVIRKINRRMGQRKLGKLGQLVFLLRGMMVRSKMHHKFVHPALRRAMRVAASNARWVRILLHGGMLLYGKALPEKEFFLRRITYLSIYLFGIIALVARIEPAQKKGRDCHNDLSLLSYFAEEALLFRKQHITLLPSRKERLHKRIIKEILE